MTLRKINTVLLVLIILINAYVLLTPFTPRLVYWWQNRDGHRQQALTAQLHATDAVTNRAQANTHPDGVVIPSMSLDQFIHEGPVSTTYRNLDQGVWRWPNGSTPDKGGNTVLLGHRFTYTHPKGVLYFMDKVRLGDEIGVWWSGKRYLYKVSSITTVPPTDTSILAPTTDSRLTIYTCTPLWKPVNRLVVVAKLEGES
ncbi:MAG: putative sortase family protein [Candidatus Saccharibacteria bacterium]|nr:putative sortase family protein [Candidatus Saccharibacteria bacterium]